MKFHICKTLLLAVAILGAGCGNLTEPSSFSFATQTGVPLNTSIKSNVVTIEGNQFAAPVAFANVSSAAYSEYSINGGTFTAGQTGDQIYPGQTLQIQQTTSTLSNAPRTTTITVGGFTTTFTTVTSTTGGSVTSLPDAYGNTVTISNVSATISAVNNIVHYAITANTVINVGSGANNPITSGTSSNLSVAFTLQAISNTNQNVYSTNASQVSISLGAQTNVGIFTGTLPTTASGNLPTFILGYPITTTNYWNGFISYWQIVSGTLTIQ